ncbi:FixH family protein [Siphonobacter sp. SORGH_AS_0500]|uniref:FixH family protein n=1 Tax=Siphonobacter sp. SORGH_AS_0500 TaxID=1864824 RepID=UPI000CB5E6FC|nr:FixH family protein [Siphonobacter sp. SORGH_AS_0500]MDR6196614.1 nitrogen fixation protein FixH [Siphonobacter sp. SORGH_AS_0500]PKK35768.1 hypothetical protein BWI96_14635 [Siphonobacter sp. SORGH_AS_0500]
MNWGKSIILAFVAFGSFIGFLVYRMASTKVDLVRKDYYQTEMAYQQQIDRIQNNKSAHNPFKINHQPSKKEIQFSIPKGLTKGRIQFFRPSDAQLDFNVAVEPNHTEQIVSTRKLKTGHWRIKITWTDGQQEYYTEEEVRL